MIMKEKKKNTIFIVLCVVSFFVSFIVGALVCVQITGSLPQRLVKVKWDDSVGKQYKNLDYVNDGGHKFDLYIPTKVSTDANLILYIHGGSFNSGSKEDGDLWCKYFTSKGYVTATLDYTLQKKGVDANLNKLDLQIKNCVAAIKEECLNMGITLNGMATCGVSAGGTLAMNYAYKHDKDSAIPVKFVFQLAGPSDFTPSEWGLLKKVNKIESDSEFIKWMTGKDFSAEEIAEGKHFTALHEISPASLVNADSVPSLVGYGLKDHCVPHSSRTLLLAAYKSAGIKYDYVEFPHSNHGMYADLDKLQLFLDTAIDYCKLYF